MGIAIGVAAILTLLGLLRLTSPAIRALTYRKGASWYLAPSLQLEATGLPADRRPTREERTPTTAIRLWLGGGAMFLGLAAVAWITGYAALGVAVGAFGLLLLAAATHAWRLNRWLVRARGWNTGHRREIPDPRRRD